jgi:hypothetical protein
VGAAGPGGQTDPAVVAWVVASCERQGVPVKVTDTAVLARVGVLLGRVDRAPRRPARRPPATRADTVTSLSA